MYCNSDNIVWYHLESRIPRNQVPFIIMGKVLILRSVKEHMKGKYRCFKKRNETLQIIGTSLIEFMGKFLSVHVLVNLSAMSLHCGWFLMTVASCYTPLLGMKDRKY